MSPDRRVQRAPPAPENGRPCAAIEGRQRIFPFALCLLILLATATGAWAFQPEAPDSSFPPELSSYEDAGQEPLARLQHRIQTNPFNLIGTLIFLLAIMHTFLAGRFTALSHRWDLAHQKKVEEGTAPLYSISARARLFHFLGEVEVVFGVWAIALVLAIVWYFDWPTAVDYISHKVNYTEAVFVVVIMTLSSTRPILKLAEALMSRVARLFGGSLAAWWLTILTIGPLLGSIITEPAAMTISALLLARKCYDLQPSNRLKYATLGLLFVNISVGGTLTHFAAPPVLMVAGPWGWDTAYMLSHFGWKAAISILGSSLFYWFIFRKEFESLRERFQIRRLKETILTDYLPREEFERELGRIGAEMREASGFPEKLDALVEEQAKRVRQGLEEEYLQTIKSAGIDVALATAAFRERFEELRLLVFQREIPHQLPPEQRAPFKDPNWNQRQDPVPAWIVLVHLAFMGWTIVNAHHPALFIAGLLLFLGFARVTEDHQNEIDLEAPMLVGFFLAGLVTHGGVQGWWIEPILGSLGEIPLMLTATLLTAFNDNAAITYLSTLVPGFTDSLKYAVVAGAVTGGGLTVIANAPNPAGQAILKQYFQHGVSPVGLLLGALAPTIFMFLMFVLFR